MASSATAKLPEEVRRKTLRGVNYSFKEREDVYNKFVQKFLKINAEDPENFNKSVIHLDKTLDKKVQRLTHQTCKKKLSCKERKRLRLYVLGKKNTKYKDLLPLHTLWEEYMINFMDLDDLRQKNWRNSPDEPKFDKISLKLYRADFHGSKMTVIRSACPGYVGKTGIMAMETRNCFKLLGSDNVMRTIPKATSVFKFQLEEFEFTFYGKNLQVKPAERSSRKIKTVHVPDF